jgi:hypothetical protein
VKIVECLWKEQFVEKFEYKRGGKALPVSARDGRERAEALWEKVESESESIAGAVREFGRGR